MASVAAADTLPQVVRECNEDLEALSMESWTDVTTVTPRSSSAIDEAGSLKSSRPRFRCWRRRVGVCASATLVALAALVFLVWPRHPSWHVKKIAVSKEAVNGLVAAFTGMAARNQTDFPLEAYVDLENPNFLGAAAGSGSFIAKYGEYELANATSHAALVRRRSPGSVSVSVTAHISPEASAVLMKVLQPDFKLYVEVTGSLPAQCTFFNVQVSIHCVVLVDVLRLVDDPDSMILSHECSYGIGF